MLSAERQDLCASCCIFNTQNGIFDTHTPNMQIVDMGDPQMTFGGIWGKIAVFWAELSATMNTQAE